MQRARVAAFFATIDPPADLPPFFPVEFFVSWFVGFRQLDRTVRLNLRATCFDAWREWLICKVGMCVPNLFPLRWGEVLPVTEFSQKGKGPTLRSEFWSQHPLHGLSVRDRQRAPLANGLDHISRVSGKNLGGKIR